MAVKKDRRARVWGVMGFLFLCAAGGSGLEGVAFGERIGTPMDVSADFEDTQNLYFLADKVTEFDAAAQKGRLTWGRYFRQPNLSFNKLDLGFNKVASSDFPGTEYDENPDLPFELTFLGSGTIRLRFAFRDAAFTQEPSLMIVGDLEATTKWKVEERSDAVTYSSERGQVRVNKDPWSVEILDPQGRILTRTQNLRETNSFAQPVPFAFVRRARDLGRSVAASFRLGHDEKIFGCGESFTRLDKRGQKVNAYIRDAMGAQTPFMYKPIPFFMSSRGYGMFVHTSTPVTFDFGRTFDETNTIYTADEYLDLFIFLGDPKEVLSEYTALTGRSPVPPLWSFGLWMSRITYNSEAQVREVARQLREHRIPADVIHLDTGWFETDWRNDYVFSKTRFDDPAKLISDLKAMGIRVSLWQLPYFTSKNALFQEIVSKGLHVRDDGGSQPFLDAVLDFSNPAAVEWYQGKLAELLKMGVGAIKVDFGEDGPFRGVYASGRTGLYEHNLYPLRYNKAAFDITKSVTGESIIWARSAWAGSQRYPLHWGGDAENTDSAMAATLRAGLSFGLSGFTYWSHDAGGFVRAPSVDLYRRWLAFGVLTSHTRCHGAPPREPWAYEDETFVDDFRRAVELKYRLIPYIYGQSVHSSEAGLPLLRTLFMEFPTDPTSWTVDDEYMLGINLLVAPLFDSTGSRTVYLPPGEWMDYQTGSRYSGGAWHDIQAGEVPVVLLVRDHSAIPHAALAQSTSDIDWGKVALKIFSSDGEPAHGLVALPGEIAHPLEVATDGGNLKLTSNPLPGSVGWALVPF